MTLLETDPIPLDKKQARRLYEPLILLCCLYTLFSHAENGVRTPDLGNSVDGGSQSTFFCFVNKLSLVCDSERGGDTVTAFGLLQTGSIEYRFTSNQRTTSGFESAKRYVKGILGVLGAAQDDAIRDARRSPEDSAIFSTIIRQVLQFTRPRITEYHIEHQFAKNLDFCINACTDSDFATTLVNLKSLAEATLDSDLSDTQFAVHGQRLLRAVSIAYNNPLYKDYLRERTREDREGANKTPWTELYHGLGRLHAYTNAVATFITARHRWPELFDPGFQVTYIPSSTPSDSPTIRRSSSGIIARLTEDPDTLALFPRTRNSSSRGPAHLEDLIGELDRKILRKIKSCEPIVHAEVHLADHILREARGNPELRFFNEATFGRYIGSSKPTCRLCHFYFSAPFNSAAGRIQVRPTSHNYYHNWRVPYIYAEDGDAARHARKELMDWLIRNVKPEAARTVVERCAVKKGHDSNTYPSVPDTESLWSGQAGYAGSQAGSLEPTRRLGSMEEIISQMGGMRLGIGQ
ncbi:hypothetical protein QBC40DRAFT_216763 [Triangularia verruculosa]|uniref:Uncharacterized protein n=1 Tax=Triangularia verruculosa TaxID=2587418 RepID=A0AAN6XRS2_9PEZI|nr:hypothetical protein QBC40DRAFT_216763 [Triangularia verruculosa]